MLPCIFAGQHTFRHDFKIQIKILLNEYSAKNIRHMGFPDDWESQPLWR